MRLRGSRRRAGYSSQQPPANSVIDFFASLTPPFAFSLKKPDLITGGTGEFADATGTLFTEGSGAILSVDPSCLRLGTHYLQGEHQTAIGAPTGVMAAQLDAPSGTGHAFGVPTLKEHQAYSPLMGVAAS
jgi:hypothetical protein